MINDQEIQAVTQRGEESLRMLPRVKTAWYETDADLIHIELNQGFSISFPLPVRKL